MARTIQELIKELETLDDKEQVFVGDVWVAEDFHLEGEFEFTTQDLEKVMEYRSLGKSLGYFYDEVHQVLTEQIERDK